MTPNRSRFSRQPRENSLGEVAAVTQRLAVLLEAGIPPRSAWRYVAVSTGSATAQGIADDTVTDLAQSIATRSASLAELDAQAWRGLAAAWAVAAQAGAPLAPSLRGYAGSLRDLSQARRDSTVALAAPAATAKMVLALPMVGVLFGMVLGFNTFATLFATPVGWSCLVVGAALITIAVRWMAAMVERATPPNASPGLSCDLMAIALAGGGSLDGARSMLHETLERFGLEPGGQVEEVLALSRDAGVPAAELLRSEADEQRRVARAEAQRAASALGVRLMLPLGLCILPAFLVLGVLPLMVSVVSSTMFTF